MENLAHAGCLYASIRTQRSRNTAGGQPGSRLDVARYSVANPFIRSEQVQADRDDRVAYYAHPIWPTVDRPLLLDEPPTGPFQLEEPLTGHFSSASRSEKISPRMP